MLLILCLAFVLSFQEHPDYLITQNLTNYIQKHANWQALNYQDNPFRGWTVEEAQEYLMSEQDLGFEREEIDTPLLTSEEAALLMKDTESISQRSLLSCTHAPMEQGKCGAGWAFASAGVLSDRCCIEKNQDFGWLSSQELISCDTANSGCNGGFIFKAVDYMKTNGLVQDSCFGYKGSNLPCPSKCENGGDWKSAHMCKFEYVVDCSREIGFVNCFDSKVTPIIARMIVYQDFMTYKSGIYCHKTGRQIGAHDIRCTGYGKDPAFHLICINSWGTKWGDSGTFKIEGKESCGMRMNTKQAFGITGIL